MPESTDPPVRSPSRHRRATPSREHHDTPATTEASVAGKSPVTSDGHGPRWFSPGVAAIGFASLGSDTGHEMTTSLLPSFLSATLHTGPATLGAIEGISDALVGLSKLAGGPLSTDPTKRGRLASGGYLVTAFATAAIGLATAVWQVAILRALAWMSRGLRSPARDSLLMSLVPRSAFGRASGVERAGDNLGAVIGPLLAAALVGTLGIRHTMLLAVIPGLLAAGAITIAAGEARRIVTTPDRREAMSFNFKELRRAGLGRALAPATLFEFGNLATTLLILRATDLLHSYGRTGTAATSIAILLYAGHNAAASACSLIAGSWIDRAGPRAVLAAGAASYVVGYALFAAGPHGIVLLAVAFALAGTGFGLLGLIQSFVDLGATLVAGLLWAFVSPALAFSYAVVWMLASVATSRFPPASPATNLEQQRTAR